LFQRHGIRQSDSCRLLINDLGTVIALGLIFSPFTIKTLIFVVVSIVSSSFAISHAAVFQEYGGRVSELEARVPLFFLFAMGGLAVWAGSEACCRLT